MPTYGRISEVSKLSDEILGTGQLLEGLEAPFEMGIVQRLLSAELVGPNGKWRCVYSVMTC